MYGLHTILRLAGLKPVKKEWQDYGKVIEHLKPEGQVELRNLKCKM